MARFLTEEWVEELNAALEGVHLPDPGPDAGLAMTDGRVVVIQEVPDTPDGFVRLVLTIDAGSVHLDLDTATGPDATGSGGTIDTADPPPNVTIALAYADAAALSQGQLTPAEALNAGRIRVRGDLCGPGRLPTGPQRRPVRARGEPPAHHLLDRIATGPGEAVRVYRTRWCWTGHRRDRGPIDGGSRMDVLSSRTIIHPGDLDRTLAFYRDDLGLAVAREFGDGDHRGVVFFAGGGLIEVVGGSHSGRRLRRPPAAAVVLWLQVRSSAATWPSWRRGAWWRSARRC